MNDRYNGEQVLVFKRDLFEKIGQFDGVETKNQKYIDKILKPENNKFYLRCKAEEDPSLKQIIPYVVFKHANTVFSYVRGKQAGEKRLVGNRSIGIGGHVNPIDRKNHGAPGHGADFLTYIEAVKREINEEVIVDGDYEPKVLALLNDESNDVGKVHFGIIHICELKSPSVTKREKQITESGFVSINELTNEKFEELESWSQIALKYISTL